MLRKCLKKDPKQRANVQDLFIDEWVTDNYSNILKYDPPQPQQQQQQRSDCGGGILEINEEDIKAAITKSFLSKRVNITAKLKQSLSNTRSNIQRNYHHSLRGQTTNV